LYLIDRVERLLNFFLLHKSSTSTMMLDFIPESIMLFFGNYDINDSSLDVWLYETEKTSLNPNIGRNQYTRLQLTGKMRGEV